MKLTDAQRWALQAIRDGHAATPAWLGQKMMERPGVDKTKGRGLKAQGYGRLGGTMVARLERMGLCAGFTYHNVYGFPSIQPATITTKGRKALEGGDA